MFMKNLILAEFKHETNRYCPIVTDRTVFEGRYALDGEAAIRKAYAGAENEMTGFFSVLDECADVRLIPLLAYNAQPGGPVDSEVWESVRDKLLECIRNTEKADGILLALHGAMVTDRTEDGEGDLLECLRREVGTDIPIIATLDLHANVTRKMAAFANGFFPYDYYPHTDLYQAGQRAARCMYRALCGKGKPVLSVHKLDYIMPYIPTDHPHLQPIVRRCQSLREQGVVDTVNVCQGFFAADIYEQGSAVVVTSHAEKALADQIAAEIGNELFAARHQLVRRYMTAREAVETALQADRYPVTVADVADNPGSGGSCDGTALLKEMLSQGVRDAAFAVIYDPETVQIAQKVGVGNTFPAEIGGKISPEITGGPLRARARVCDINDGVTRNREGCSKGLVTFYGTCAVLQVEGIKIIVSSIRTQPWSLDIYRKCGIDPGEMKILAVKSTVQFRASFETVSPVILYAECPGLGPQSPKMLPLSHSRRPIFPLDDL